MRFRVPQVSIAEYTEHSGVPAGSPAENIRLLENLEYGDWRPQITRTDDTLTYPEHILKCTGHALILHVIAIITTPSSTSYVSMYHALVQRPDFVATRRFIFITAISCRLARLLPFPVPETSR